MWGPDPISLVTLSEEEEISLSLVPCEKRPCTDIVRRQLSASQEKDPYQELTQWVPHLVHPSLQNCDKFCQATQSMVFCNGSQS